MKKGILIVVEGIDGAGKSTLVNLLGTQLHNNTRDVILTKEPGGSALGKHLRELLQHQPTPITSRAEYLLFAADRAQHFNDIVIPSLQKGSIVISDRMGDSSLAYQGYGRGHDLNMVHTINEWTMHGIKPDITFYLKISLTAAYERIQQRNAKVTVFEQEKKEFMERVSNGFNTIYKNKTNVITLDGTQNKETIAHTAYTHVIQWINKHTM